MKTILVYFISTLYTQVFTSIEDTMTNAPYTTYNHWVRDPETNLFVQVTDSCQYDQNWAFNSNHTMVMKDTIVSCDTLKEFMYMKFKWQLNSAEDKLSFVYLKDTTDFRVQFINSDSLILTSPYDTSGSQIKFEKIVLTK